MPNNKDDEQLDKTSNQPDDPNVSPREISTEMERSYLEYAMSVIVARALPDVRDGLKPVHRRILWAMWDMGLRAGVKYRKSATVVGEVLGKYHPHGDISVYDALVRMAQDFSLRYPLLDGQGNFGSIDGDNPAAMRYTEIRMLPFAQELLFDIEKDTVSWIDNYDATRKEPQVLPSKVPNLLLNGALGIAVGMATNIPPHNLTELVDALVHLVDNPEAELDDLMEFIKGPDFPTGGTIFDNQEIKAAYGTGKGRIIIRAKATIEEDKKGAFRIVISELPYQVNKSELVVQIAELVRNKKIIGISDLRDESDRKDAVRIVVELKSSAFPKKILNSLYNLTQMTTAFHVNMVTLLDGIQPRLLTLKTVLNEHLKHRFDVLTRRSQFELRQAQARAHILEGLTKALDHIDAVISVIRGSANRDVAKVELKKKFSFSDEQAQAILEMRLGALAALERGKIKDEYDGLKKLITELQALLADPKKIYLKIKEELIDIKNRFGDERRTAVNPNPLVGFTAEDLIPNEDVIVTLTHGGYVKRMLRSTYRAQIRGGVGISGMGMKEEDQLLHVILGNTHDDIWFFTDLGRLFTAKVYDIPAVSRQAKGLPIQNLIQLGPQERVTAVIVLPKKLGGDGQFVVFGTQNGVIKKTPIERYRNARKSGLIAIDLRDGDKLLWVRLSSADDQIFMVTAKGQAILFSESEVRPMGRSAAGVRAIRLRSGDQVMGMDVISGVKFDQNPDVSIVLGNGFGKRTPLKLFRNQRRGGIGIKVANVTSRTGNVVGMEVTWGDEGDFFILTAKGTVIRVPLRTVKRLGRDTQGVIVMRPKPGDRVVSATHAVDEPEEKPAPTPEPPKPKK